MRIVIFGLSITSAWGNGHATTYRSLVKGLAECGHDIVFFERDVPWYAAHRDQPFTPHVTTRLYHRLEDLAGVSAVVADASLVIVGSYVPQGGDVIDWVLGLRPGVVAFYDIDTPITIGQLAAGDAEYVRRDQVPSFDLYLTFTGGPMLERLHAEFGAARPRPLYCAVDPGLHAPVEAPERWDLGYLGTYSADRQVGLDLRLLEPARRWAAGRFVVAGAQYPPVEWPGNVEHVEHVSPADHRAFFGAQRFTLNLTRQAMVAAGYSPGVRLFEAAASGVPIISDAWDGLSGFFTPGEEIVVTHTASETLQCVRDYPVGMRRALAARARARVLAEHTYLHRARTLEQYVAECRGARRVA